MKRTPFRTLAAMTAGVALLTLTACSGGGGFDSGRQPQRRELGRRGPAGPHRLQR